jgi:PKD repeat protein
VKIKIKVGTLALVFALLANPVFGELASGSYLGPTASFTASPTAVMTGNPVSFDATTSHDSRGNQSLQYRFDFEGNYAWTRWMGSPKASYTFEEEGSFTTRLQVKDSDDLIDETNLTINVQTKRSDHAPTARIHVAHTEGDTSTNFSFTVEVFSKIHTPSHLLQVRWDWDHDGIWDTAFSRAREFFHVFDHEGWQEVWVEVKDTDGSSSIEKGYYVEGKENDSVRNKEVGLVLVGKVTAPRAGFKTWPVEISPNTNVHFDASESIRAVEYRWDFDGNGRFDTSWNSNKEKVQRIYNTVGVFDAILEVRNSLGEIDRTQRTIAVADSNNILPEAKITIRNQTNASLGSRLAVLRDEIKFSASRSRDEDGSEAKMEVRWDFEGDSVFDTTFSTDKTAIHRYISTGTHTPILQVRDERGGLASTQAQIRVVANTPTIAKLKITPALGTRETNFRFDASGSRDDQTKTSNLDYRFDFNGDGFFDTEFKASRVISRKIPKAGKFTAVVEVRDHANAVSRATAEFEIVEPAPPTAAFVVEPRVGTFNTNFQFDASLTSDSSRVGGRLSYRWDFDYRDENDINYDTGWSSSSKYRHRFLTIGDHRIRLTVKNSAGHESEFFTKIKVHEESESLQLLRRKGIITSEDNPDKLLTRSEFAQMIVKATKIRAVRPRNQQFTDISVSDRNAPYIAAVSARGWISPKADFAWQPEGSVNRAEASKVIVSALYPYVAETSASQLKDIPVGAWYARFANVVVEGDLLDIQNNEFRPAQAMTKAEAARMIAKLIQKYSFELRLSNLFQSNDFDLHAAAPKSFVAKEFLSSLLEKIKNSD